MYKRMYISMVRAWLCVCSQLEWGLRSMCTTEFGTPIDVSNQNTFYKIQLYNHRQPNTNSKHY